MSASANDDNRTPARLPSLSAGSARLLAPATATTASKKPPMDSHDPGAARSSKQPKRSNITNIACQPCRQRKQKCNGARPVCAACSFRNRSDCFYDITGDQRRSVVMRQRIEDLETQERDLKDIITAIGSAQNGDVATGIARELAEDGFQCVRGLASDIRAENAARRAPRITVDAKQETASQSTPSLSMPVDVSDSTTSETTLISTTTMESVRSESPSQAVLPSWQIEIPFMGTMDDLGLIQQEYENTIFEAIKPGGTNCNRFRRFRGVERYGRCYGCVKKSEDIVNLLAARPCRNDR